MEDGRYTIGDFLDRAYELDVYRYHGVRFVSDPIEKDSDRLPDDLFEMVTIEKVDDEGVHWTINLSEYEGQFGSVTSGSKIVKHGEKYKHRHEFVCESFQTGKTDEKMSTIEKLDDDDDYRTPDFIITTELGIHVIEITTVKLDRIDLLMKAYRTKEFSYLNALNNRSTNKIITYTIIVVSPNRILSTVELPDVLTIELIARMRLALCLERRAEMINLDLEDDELSEFQNTIRKKIEESVKSVDYPINKEGCNRLEIDANYVQSCKSHSNETEVIEDLLREMDNTRQQIIKTREDNNYKKEIEDFKTSFQSGSRRYDKKNITFFPYINTKETDPSSDIPKVPVNDSKTLPTVSKLWGAAMDYYELNSQKEDEDPTSLLMEALEEDKERVKEYEDIRKGKRRKYHRVDLRSVLNNEDIETLATQGLWAKKHKNDDFMKARRIHQQSGFKWSTDVSDIEEWLNDMSDLELINSKDDKSIQLLEHANLIAGNSNKATNVIKDWKKTSLYQSMEIISDIAYEVAISNKQHCKSKEMILKKLRKYNVYLLISPTKSSEHTFVSLFIPKPCKIKHSTVFGRVHNSIGGYITDFFSIKQGKLENQSSMPSSLLSLAAFWSWFYEMDGSGPKDFEKNNEAMFMLKFSLLMRLEDKSQTEETITQTRYMYMEIFKSSFSVVDPLPFKMLSKFTNYPRSRLNLYCLKQMVKNFTLMVETPPVRVLNTENHLIEEGEDAVPNDSWANLLNWISGGVVPTASRAINLVYLGYLKNKMEASEGNTDFQLVEKTCEEEFKLDWNEISKSKGDCDTRPKGKQFKMNSIIHGCEIMIKRLKLMFGSAWKVVVENDILVTLSKRMTVELATLKASANISHSETEIQSCKSSNYGSNRLKAIEAVSKMIDKISINPMMSIHKMISYIESTSKGVVCDLFKKQQHGGLREIYVLTIQSRIVQLFIETISRVICTYFEEETLTHPKNKLKKLDEHRSNTARISTRDDCIYADYCSSTDKTRWNQNFVMPAMIIPLIKLTPDYFHPSITRIMNMWTNKLIKLPQRVVNLLIDSVSITSETYKKLHDEFWSSNNTNESLFLTKNGSFIHLSSGMMQGILHYTSSLLHLTFLNSMNHIIPTVLRKMFPSHSFLMTQVCSSDDSASIVTVLSPKGHRTLTRETYIACKKVSHIMETLNNMSPYYCMINSIKSTTAVIDYVEFNSEFIFRNTIAIPIIKFVAASLNVTESESFLERFHTMYNLMSDLFSSGLPAEQAHLCQLSQGLNHYKTMGSSVNPLYEIWSEEIIAIPDPILGFFLVDSELCPGVLGYSYSYWKCAKETNILRRSVKSLLSDVTEIIDGGGIVQSLIIKHGDVKRWRNLAKEVVGDLDIVKEIESNPELLFRDARTPLETRIAIGIKSTMPSVAKSLRRGNPYMQSLAMSVYSINTHCFSKSSVTQDLTGVINKEYSKTSILHEMSQRLRALDPSVIVSKEQMDVSFPARERYEEAQKIIDDFKNFSLIKCPKFRNRRTEVYVQPFSSFVPLSLLQTCKAVWFGHKVKTSVNILKRCFEAYKAKIPWIRDNIKETLLSSPFITYQELSNFISSHTIKTRLYVRVGPGVFSKRLSGQIFHLIKKSQRDGYVLKAPSTPGAKLKEYKGTAEVISKLSLALSLPFEDARTDQVTRILITSPKLYDSLLGIQKMPKRDASLAYIQGYVKGDFTMEDISTSIQQTGLGILFAYTKMQQREETDRGIEWKGPGQCYVYTDQMVMIIDMIDDYATKVEVSNWSKIRTKPSSLSLVLRELGLHPKKDTLRYLTKKLVAKFDGTNWTLPGSVGIPIMENINLIPRYRDPPLIQFKIGFQSMSLSQKTPRGYASLLRFKTYPGDVMVNKSLSVGTNIHDCWINQKTLREDIASGTIISTIERNVPTNVKSWVIDTLMARLSQKGLSKGPGELSRWIPVMDVDYQIHDIEATTLQIERMALMAIDDTESSLGLDYIPIMSEIPKLEEKDISEFTEDSELSNWAFVMHNWAIMEIEENVDITSRGVKSFKYMHPFWDKMIDQLEDQCPKFWENTFAGYIQRGFDRLSGCLITLLGLKVKTKPKTLLEQVEHILPELITQLEISDPQPSTSGVAHTRKDDNPSWSPEPEDDEDIEDLLY